MSSSLAKDVATANLIHQIAQSQADPELVERISQGKAITTDDAIDHVNEIVQKIELLGGKVEWRDPSEPT